MLDILPCDDCDDETKIEWVSNCRCKHMSVFANAYQKTSKASGLGPTIGIYSDFFALSYWAESFGFFAVMAGITVFFLGHIVIYFVDTRLQQKLILRLREKVRKIEMKVQGDPKTGNLMNKKSLVEMQDDDAEE